jgi:TonB family protein
MSSRRLANAFERLSADAPAPALEFPGLTLEEPESSRRAVVAGSLASFLHLGTMGFLVLLASLAPVIDEDLIPVQLLQEEPELDEPAPAPKALAERRMPNFAPSVQAVQPQVVNPRVVAEASPSLSAEALQMDSVSAVVAPVQISRATAVVERVSAVKSIASARASAVDTGVVGGPAVRGPIRAVGPVGPSVGPRQVAVASTGTSMGTGTLEVGGGSSVREGVLSTRDVLGSPDGAPLVRVDVSVGEGYLGGSGGSGTGTGTGGSSSSSCIARPEVQAYMGDLKDRTIERWTLPPGLEKNQEVVVRFQLDVAGSATRISVVRASDNALGASAVDALRTASPYPPLPDRVRCLARSPITATFTNPL